MEKSKRLEILENSLLKKENLFDSKIQDHFADVKQGNGQPMNDKRNGRATLNRWEKQNNSLRNLQDGIEITKNAIESEKYKIKNIESVKEGLPDIILKLLEDKVLIQWRKHPNTFFVEGVDKVRIVWNPNDKNIGHKYSSEVTEQVQWSKFVKVFNEINNILRASK